MSLDCRAALHSIVAQKIALSADPRDKLPVGKIIGDVLARFKSEYEVSGPYLVGSRVAAAVLSQFKKDGHFGHQITCRDIDVKIIVVAKGEGSALEERIACIQKAALEVLTGLFSEGESKGFLSVLPPVSLGRYVTQFIYEVGPSSYPLQLSLYVHKNEEKTHPMGIFSFERLFFDLSEKDPLLRLDVAHRCSVLAPSEFKGKYNSYVHGCLSEFEKEIDDFVDVEGVSPAWTSALKDEIEAYRRDVLLPYEKNKESAPQKLFEGLIRVRKRVKDLLEVAHTPLALAELRSGILYCPRPHEIFSGMWRYMEKLVGGFRSPIKGLIEAFWRGEDYAGLLKGFTTYFITKKKYTSVDLIAIYLQLQMIKVTQPAFKALQSYGLQQLKELLAEDKTGLVSFITASENIEPLIWPLILQAEDFLVVYHEDELALRLQITHSLEKSFFLLVPFSLIPKDLPFPSEDQLLFLMTLSRKNYRHQDVLLAGEKKKILDVLKSTFCPFYLYLWSHKQRIPIDESLKLQFLRAIIKYQKYFQNEPARAIEDIIANLSPLDVSTIFTLLQSLRHVPQNILAKHILEVGNLVQLLSEDTHEMIVSSQRQDLILFFAATLWQIWSSKMKFKEAFSFFKKLADSSCPIVYTPALQGILLREKEKAFVRESLPHLIRHREIFDASLTPLYLEWADDPELYLKVISESDVLEAFWLPSLEKALECSLRHLKAEVLFIKLWTLGYRNLATDVFLKALKEGMALEKSYEKILHALQTMTLSPDFWKGLLPLLTPKTFEKTCKILSLNEAAQKDPLIWETSFPFVVHLGSPDVLRAFISLKKEALAEDISALTAFMMHHPLCTKFNEVLWTCLAELLAHWYTHSASFKSVGKPLLEKYWTTFLEGLPPKPVEHEKQKSITVTLMNVMNAFFQRLDYDYFEMKAFETILTTLYSYGLQVRLKDHWSSFFSRQKDFFQRFASMSPIIVAVFPPPEADRLAILVTLFQERLTNPCFEQQTSLFSALDTKKRLTHFNGPLSDDVFDMGDRGKEYAEHVFSYFREESAKDEVHVREKIPYLGQLLHYAVLAGDKVQAKTALRNLLSLRALVVSSDSPDREILFLRMAHCYLIFLQKGSVDDITEVRMILSTCLFELNILLASNQPENYFFLLQQYDEALLREGKEAEGGPALIDSLISVIKRNAVSCLFLKAFIHKPFEWVSPQFPHHNLINYVSFLANYIDLAPFLLEKIVYWILSFGEEVEKTKSSKQLKVFLEDMYFMFKFLGVNAERISHEQKKLFVQYLQVNLLASGVCDTATLNNYEVLYNRSLHLIKDAPGAVDILRKQAAVVLAAENSLVKIHLTASLIQYMMQVYKISPLSLRQLKSFIPQILSVKPLSPSPSYKFIQQKIMTYLLWNIEPSILWGKPEDGPTEFWEKCFSFIPKLLLEGLYDDIAAVPMITISTFVLAKKEELDKDGVKVFGQIVDILNVKHLNPIEEGIIDVRRGIHLLNYHNIMSKLRVKLVASSELSDHQKRRLAIIDTLVGVYTKDLLKALRIPIEPFDEALFFLQAKLFSTLIT